MPAAPAGEQPVTVPGTHRHLHCEVRMLIRPDPIQSFTPPTGRAVADVVSTSIDNWADKAHGSSMMVFNDGFNYRPCSCRHPL